jgi:hypothetical protein
MTENLKIRVSAHLINPSGFVAQKSRPETNLLAALDRGDEKQVFAVTLGVTACSASKSRSGLFQLCPLMRIRRPVR